VHGARVVHGLVGHAGRHGPVADHRDDVVGLAAEIAGDRHAEPGRDRRRRMGGAEGVVLALAALGEAGQAAGLAQGANAVAAAGQDLVRIGLVADVPDESVARRVEDVVQGDSQLDHAQARAEVAARYRDGIDGLGAKLLGDLEQLALGNPAQILRDVDAVEQGGGTRQKGGPCRGGKRAPALS
jgi:hypothetical protein